MFTEIGLITILYYLMKLIRISKQTVVWQKDNLWQTWSHRETLEDVFWPQSKVKKCKERGYGFRYKDSLMVNMMDDLIWVTEAKYQAQQMNTFINVKTVKNSYKLVRVRGGSYITSCRLGVWGHFFHQGSSSIKGCLSSKVVFHRRSSSIRAMYSISRHIGLFPSGTENR